jgi:hypothetical protein
MYARISPKTQKKELIAHACHWSMNWSEAHIIGVKRDDSLLPGQDCVHVKAICWMNPWACVELIPSSATKLDVYVYNTYLSSFSFYSDVKLNMQLIEQSADPKGYFEYLTPIASFPWPMKTAQKPPQNKMIKQYITTLDIDRSGAFKGKELCLLVQFVEYGGNWKSGWILEAVSCEFDNGVAPKLDKTNKVTPRDVPVVKLN